MTALGRSALAVLVILGWMTALVWLAVSVSQIAVEHTVVRTCTVHLTTPQEETCWE